MSEPPLKKLRTGAEPIPEDPVAKLTDLFGVLAKPTYEGLPMLSGDLVRIVCGYAFNRTFTHAKELSLVELGPRVLNFAGRRFRLGENIVYFSTYVVDLYTQSDKHLWRWKSSGVILGVMPGANEMEIVVSGSNSTVYVLNAYDGEETAQFAYGKGHTAFKVTPNSDGTVIIGDEWGTAWTTYDRKGKVLDWLFKAPFSSEGIQSACPGVLVLTHETYDSESRDYTLHIHARRKNETLREVGSISGKRINALVLVDAEGTLFVFKWTPDKFTVMNLDGTVVVCEKKLSGDWWPKRVPKARITADNRLLINHDNCYEFGLADD